MCHYHDTSLFVSGWRGALSEWSIMTRPLLWQRVGVAYKFRVAYGADGAGGNAGDGGVCRNVAGHYRTRADAGSGTDPYIVHYAYSRAYVHIVADMGGIGDIGTDGGELPECYIVAYHRLTVYDQAAAMLYVHAVAYDGTRRYKQSVLTFVPVGTPAR